ncbi:MAG: transglutaminase domain-containing protein [Lachnospiraceae bacterium]|nr:transglutaminase domain-containing protein [Lachnospiraceae bacterium]
MMTDLAGRIRYAAAAAILSGVVCSGCGVLPQGTLPSLPFTAEESGAETAGAAGDVPATGDSTGNAGAAGDSAGDAAREKAPGEAASGTEEAGQNAGSEASVLEPAPTYEAEALSDGSSTYGYHLLTAEGQKIYDEVLSAVRERRTVTVSTLDKDKLNQVYDCVTADHPELFYISGYTYTKHSVMDKLLSISFEGNYEMTARQQEDAQKIVDDYTARCFNDLPADADQYETAKYLFDYIVTHTDYDTAAEDNQTILSAMQNGRSVCSGYAKSFQFLLNKAGIPCTLVTGTACGSPHAWNLVLLDGDYYFFDVTFGDASYLGSDVNRAVTGYEYFGVTSEETGRTHTADGRIPLPVCRAEADNYYVHENARLQACDTQRIAELARKAAAEGAGILRLQAATAPLYDELLDQLIGQQQIYNFLPGVRSLNYIRDKDMRTLTFCF